MTFRLLILSNYPSPDRDVSGGVPRCVESTVSALSKLDPSIEIFVSSFSSKVKTDVTSKSGNLTVHYIPFPLTNYPIFVPRCVTNRIIRREIMKVRPDIIHVQGIGKYYSFPILKECSNPVILTVHGIIHQESKSWRGLLGKYRGYVGRHLEKNMLNRAKYLIAVSPYVKRTIAPMTAGDISVIYNSLDEIFFSINKNEVPNRILFVGGIEERKGLHVLIDAIAAIKQTIPAIKLHIVGGIRKASYYNDLLNQIVNLGLQDSIVFKNHLSNSELMQEYSEAALFVLPSKEESLGVVLLEAMATGTPIVASNIGGIPDIIEDGQNGYLVNYGDSQAMASSIIKLLSDDKLRGEMGAKGKEMAKNYVPHKIAMEHLSLYKRVFREVL
jgi:glycosyltransferase involved in cell wall biosynthesis